MSTISYREYLNLVEKYNRSAVPVAKALASLALLLVFVFIISFYLSAYQNKKIEPASAQSIYFQNASTSFYKSRQSLDDLFSGFQVAGTKTEKIDQLKESSQSAQTPGFFITLGDTQKIISEIKSTKDNLEAQRQIITKLDTPQVYETLNKQIIEFLNDSQTFLDNIENTQEHLKDLILASGPNFYLPTLSDETTWQTQDIEKIKNYYETRKKDALAAMEAFNKIQTIEELKPYRDTQLQYFQLVVNLSDNILSVLNRPQAPPTDDSASLIEEAYQVLTGAKRENELISQKLLDERLLLTSSQSYSSRIASLNNKARIIESGLADGNKVQLNAQTKVQNDDLLSFIRSLTTLHFSGFTK